MKLTESYRNRMMELAGVIQENMHLYRNHIEDQLKSIPRGTPLLFIKHGEDHNRKAYYSGFRNNAHWANYVGGGPSYNSYQNDVRIFPAKDIEITRIGNDTIESESDYQDRIEAIKQINKEKRGQELNQMYRDAYRQEKLYPNVD